MRLTPGELADLAEQFGPDEVAQLLPPPQSPPQEL
jgi:hypothetical protein